MAVCAIGFAAGIAFYDITSLGAILAVSILMLLFILIIYWKNKEKEFASRIAQGEAAEIMEENAGRITSAAVFAGYVLFLIFFAAGGVRCAISDCVKSAYSEMNDKAVTVTATVLSEQHKEGKTALIARICDDEDCKYRAFGEKIRITLTFDETDIGGGNDDIGGGNDDIGGGNDDIGDGNDGIGDGSNDAHNGSNVADNRSNDSDQNSSEISEENVVDKTVWTGRVVQIKGKIYEPQSSGNPHVFDYRKYLRTQGVRIGMSAKLSDAKLVGEPEGIDALMHFLSQLKMIFAEKTQKYMDSDTSGLLAGILFGTRDEIDAEIYEEFQRNGIAHLLAVSGLHISMIYGLLRIIFGKPATLAGNAPIAVLLVMYAAMSGFSPSVVRAVFMICVNIVGKVTFRRYDSLSCISFCALTLLGYRPYYLFSSGFELSFLAVITISVIMPHNNGDGKSRKKKDDLSDDQWGKIKDDLSDDQWGKIKEKKSRNRSLEDKSLKPAASHMIPSGLTIKYAKVRKKLSEFYSEKSKMVLQSVKDILLMQAGMMPASLCSFHFISTGVLLLNVPAIWIAGFAVPLGVVMIPTSFVAAMTEMHNVGIFVGKLFEWMCAVEDMLLSVLVKMSSIIADTPFSYKYLASPPTAVLLMYYGMLFFFCSEAGRSYINDGILLGNTLHNIRSGKMHGLSGSKRHELSESKWYGLCGGLRYKKVIRGAAAAVIIAIVSIAVGTYFQWNEITSDLIFVDVGQGDCAHLKCRGKNILFDTGGTESFSSSETDVGKDILIPYLLGSGISELDLVVLSHLHQDHCGGLETMTEGVKVRKLALSAAYKSQGYEISEKYGIDEENIIFLKAGDVLEIGGASIQILAPAVHTDEEYQKILENSEDENELSMIFRVVYKDTSILFTGDIDSEYEMNLAEMYNRQEEGATLCSDILKTAHHGSRYSTCDEFIDAVSPTAAVIQVGRNFYGHPSQFTLDRLEAADVPIYRNDTQGAIFVRCSQNFFNRRHGGYSMFTESEIKRDFYKSEGNLKS